MSPASRALRSGKAGVLASLQAAGLPVPDFVVVPDAVLVLAEPERSRRLLAAVAPLLGRGWRLAVRSSVHGEDGAGLARAGLFRTELDVRDEPQSVVDAALACRSSLGAPAVAAYAAAAGVGLPQAMDLVVQRMVAADAAGVVFTADPISGSRGEYVIAWHPGRGDALVSGRVAGRTDRVVPMGPWPDLGALKSPCVRELCRLAAAVEDLFGGTPQDLEFAVESGRVWLLQARPITSGPTARPTGAMRILWDNANIAESYSGVTTPLTMAVIRTAYTAVYRQFLEFMGVRQPPEEVVSRMLGFYGGRVYYQMQSWYAALGALPLFRLHRPLLEQMMGTAPFEPPPPPAGLDGALRVGAWVGRMAYRQLRLGRDSARFVDRVEAVLLQHSRDALLASDLSSLRRAYTDFQTRVLAEWRTPIVVDFLVMVWYGALTRLCRQWLSGSPGAVNTLMEPTRAAPTGATAPLVALRAAALRLNQDRGLADSVEAALGEPAAGSWPDWPELDMFLADYGDRCWNELRLEEPNLRDQPATAARLALAMARGLPHGTRIAPGRGAGLPSTGQHLVPGVAELTWPRCWILAWVADRTRTLVARREELRLVRSRVFGRLRDLFRAAGGALAAAGALAEAEDVFYLTPDEIWTWVEGTAVSEDLKSLVAIRRDESFRWRETVPPDRFQTRGLPYQARPQVEPAGGSDGAAVHSGRDGDSGPEELSGTACSGGRVIGRVKLLSSPDPEAVAAGDIIVAERTDPGWVFVYALAAGLIVEHGSPLSHAAIAARELGLPAIVNVQAVTRRLATGERIAMDGTTGLIQRLGR